MYWKRILIALICLLVGSVYFFESIWVFITKNVLPKSFTGQEHYYNNYNNNNCSYQQAFDQNFTSRKYLPKPWIHSNRLIIFNDIFFRSDGKIIIVG